MNFVKIKSIEEVGVEQVYDIEVEDDNSFFANGIAVHNCIDPNIQQSPKNYEYRRIFDCPEGFEWFESDVDGFHLRICALMSGDEAMKELFNSSTPDMHLLTSYGIFLKNIDINVIRVTKDNGEFIELYENQPIKIKRNDKEIEILAKELKETDVLI